VIDSKEVEEGGEEDEKRKEKLFLISYFYFPFF